MKNTFGQSVTLTIFGESHGKAIGAVIDGLAPGLDVDEEFIKEQLYRRRPYGKISTARAEEDRFDIVSGVYNKKTTGTPLCIIIENSDTHSKDYSELENTPRPSHADYTGIVKYRGFADPRGGGHFSGRITAAIVASGAIILSALDKKGIHVGTHIKRCADISDVEFSNLENDIKDLSKKRFATISDDVAQKMISKIEDAAAQKDSVGGILETAITGLPAGIGEPWFDSFESVLSRGLFAIPAVKGVEFGLGFSFADTTGSLANDCFTVKNGKIETVTNNNGGINGGITNGMPVIFRTAIKPTPSVFREQQTVNVKEMKDVSLTLSGRHDPAIFHRAAVVVDSIAAFTVADLLAQKFGTDWLSED